MLNSDSLIQSWGDHLRSRHARRDNPLDLHRMPPAVTSWRGDAPFVEKHDAQPSRRGQTQKVSD